jgi:putative endonuclease
MATHNESGKKGEQLGKQWLEQNRYEVLQQNWRHSHLEIDIIARKESTLHFIEVKARHNIQFGYPEESVDKRKIENILKAAEEFLHSFLNWNWVQYDVLAIHLDRRGQHEYFLIEDVYL